MPARYGNFNIQRGTLFFFLCSLIVDLSFYWQRFQVKSTVVCSCFEGVVYVRLYGGMLITDCRGWGL